MSDTTSVKTETAVHPFDLSKVRLLDGPFKEAMERDRAYLHDLSADRLLHTWRINAGLPSDASPLGGWEKPDCEVRGHTLGHFLSACALMYASAGDEGLKEKADGIVAELAKCQEALGNGYLSAFPEEFIDRAEAREQVWAPYYTLHKMFAGLLDMYRHCNNQQALEIARKMADWLKHRLDKFDNTAMQEILNHTEQGGMNEALANLYSVTGNEDYLQLSRKFNQNRYLDPLSRGEDKLKGEHVNSFIPNIIGTARQYEVGGREGDRKTAEYFWNQVTGARCYCTGGTSNREHWQTGPNELATELGDFTQETCCTYNMLKLTRHLFCWDPQPKYADYYERALWNSILSTQNPADGMMMYFIPLGSGRWKMFNLPYDSFWCCTGTGLENHAKYGDSIYFHDDNRLFVNLFIASEVEWEPKGVRIRQETTFPESESTALVVSVESPTEFSIHFRIPYWATQGITAKVNGQPIDVPEKPQSYLVVRRTWKTGDRLEVTLPMSLHVHPMPDDESLVAFMHGPFVLAGILGVEGLTRGDFHTSENWYKFEDVAEAPPLVGDVRELDRWFLPVVGFPSRFRTYGQQRDITFLPYHCLFTVKYAVYWRVNEQPPPEGRGKEEDAKAP